MGSVPGAPLDAADNQKPSDNPIIGPNTQNTAISDYLVPTTCQSSDLHEPAEDGNQVTIKSVDHLGILSSEDLVPIILSHLPHDFDALAKLMRTNKMYKKAGERYLWQRADVRQLLTYVTSASRRESLARMMERVVFFDHEVIWPAQALPCPEFDRVKSLELYATTLHCNPVDRLLPFIHNTLQELKIWTDAPVVDQMLPTLRDNLWVSRIASTCTKLHTLKLEAALDVSLAQLNALFEALPQIEVLHLGSQLSSVLSDDAITAIMRMPALTDLSIDFELTSLLMNNIVGMTAAESMLPQIERLHVAFADGEDYGPVLLLGALTNVKTLSMKLSSIQGEQARTLLHPSFFGVLSLLPELEFASLYLSANIHLTRADVECISSSKASIHLTASAHQFQHPQLPVPVILTGADLANSSITSSFLATLESLALPSIIEATYHEVIELTQAVMAVSPSHLSFFNLTVDEAAPFG